MIPNRQHSGTCFQNRRTAVELSLEAVKLLGGWEGSGKWKLSKDQAQVVQKVDINLYYMESAIVFPNTYPLDCDYPLVSPVQRFNDRGLDTLKHQAIKNTVRTISLSVRSFSPSVTYL